MKTQKLIKNYFERFKRDQKKVFSVKKKFKDDARKTWSAMKEILRKHTTRFSNHPTKITVNKTDIFDVKKIADEFNKLFIKIGTVLANKIPKCIKSIRFLYTGILTGKQHPHKK